MISTEYVNIFLDFLPSARAIAGEHLGFAYG